MINYNIKCLLLSGMSTTAKPFTGNVYSSETLGAHYPECTCSSTNIR